VFIVSFFPECGFPEWGLFVNVGCGEDVGDIDDPDRVAVADDGQLPHPRGQHGLGRVADGSRGGDGVRTCGQQVMDVDLVEVLALRHRAGDVSRGDDGYRPVGLDVDHDQGGRAGVVHQVGGRGGVVALGYRLGGRPHDVGDVSRNGAR